MGLFRWMLANGLTPADVADLIGGDAVPAGSDSLHHGINMQF